MSDTFMARLAATFVCLSLASEFAAVGLAMSHGAGPATMNAMNWGVGEQLLFFQQRWMASLFSLAILAPCLSMLAWLAIYSVLTPGGPAAFCGTVVTSFGFLLGVVAEMIRFSVTMTLPPRYVAASDVAKPAMLALGAFLSQLFVLLAQASLMLIYAVGMPLVALVILKTRVLPRWLGWVLLLPSILVGYVGGPVSLLGYPSTGGPFIGAGLNIFFVWYVVLGIMLLRWRPTGNAARDVTAGS